ncbi:MAG: DUF4197 domain-containing protein [Pseudomonadota bacterium]|nr:DUF4197 domain-containing protein [Pseudomonadota bacterium]
MGRNGGFADNSRVRIPLPGKLDQAGKLARHLGQGAKVDAFELSMNRAAEKAVPQVAQIFGDAIRKMSLSDARAILTGSNHAATDYFRRVAGDLLTAKIHPIVAAATDRVGVTQKYKSFTAGSGGALGGALGSLRSSGGKSTGRGSALDLDDYVTPKDTGRIVHRDRCPGAVDSPESGRAQHRPAEESIRQSLNGAAGRPCVRTAAAAGRGHQRQERPA